MKVKIKRFDVVHKESNISASSFICVDRLTGVNYLFVASGYAGGLTPLLDKDGNVVVSPVYSEDTKK